MRNVFIDDAFAARLVPTLLLIPTHGECLGQHLGGRVTRDLLQSSWLNQTLPSFSLYIIRTSEIFIYNLSRIPYLSYLL